MNFLYPYKEEGKMKLKFTVSELKKRESLREEAGEELIQEPEIVPLLPHFMEEQDEGLTGASERRNRTVLSGRKTVKRDGRLYPHERYSCVFK